MPGGHGDRDAELLGLRPNPTHEEVKAAWLAFARKWHPDMHPAGPERDKAEDRFKMAQSAHASLLARPRAGEGVHTVVGEHNTASYVRRRRATATAGAQRPLDYGSLGYDQNARAKITVGLTVFALFVVWASNAWSRQSDESRRRQQSLSTVSYGEQHAFWRTPPSRR
ncbi:hypothetical protein KFE25_003842 [Diacronema lutheri]|uniref:J domain-containing protein n=2 Tax=Diacronema lutheri TaxID=2081491 RepID=A0A8J6C8E5_DIALT|nr:hypothetical protein KFE25_003842 [Diacronema lutheri]